MSSRKKLRPRLQTALIALFAVYNASLLYFAARASLLQSILVVVLFGMGGLLAWGIRDAVYRRKKGLRSRSAGDAAGKPALPLPLEESSGSVEKIAAPGEVASRGIPAGVPDAVRRNATFVLIVLFGFYDLMLLYWGAGIGFVKAVFAVLAAAPGGVLAWRLRESASRILSRRYAINILVLAASALTCVSLYSGLVDMSYPITQDFIPAYAGTRYVLAHPLFAFVFGYPQRFPLLPFYWYVVQSLTGDTHWMNLVASFAIHVVNAFLVFKITGLICGEAALISRLVAAFVFLISPGHHQTLLTFPHTYPVLNSFFGLLSLFFFLKVNVAPGQFRRGELYLSVLFYLLSMGFGQNFVALPLLYLLVMAVRFGRFRKDLGWTFLMAAGGVAVLFGAGEVLRQVYGIGLAQVTDLLSWSWFEHKISTYDYSFLRTVALFFPGFPPAVATFIHGTETVLADVGVFHGVYFWHFSLAILVVPVLFLDKKKALVLYGLLALMLLLFVPFTLAPRVVNHRHVLQGIAVAAVFVGVLSQYVVDSIGRLGAGWLGRPMMWTVIAFWAVFGVRLAVITRSEVGKFVVSSGSDSIEKFIEQFERITVQDERKQIYFLTNTIPATVSLIGNPAAHCYYFYYLATKYKGLPIDLYRYVYMGTEVGPLDEEGCRNYFITLGDEGAFGFFTDKEKLRRVLEENRAISPDNVIVLTWEDGLKQRGLDRVGGL